MKPASAAADEVRSGATAVAERLRAAREARSMSVHDVADALHLDHRVVMALEGAEFDSLGAAVFVKGYLRSYARLLGLNEAELIEQCVVTGPDPDEFRSVSVRREVRAGASLPMVLLGGVLTTLLLTGGLYLWSSADSPPAPPVSRSSPRPAAAEQPRPDSTPASTGVDRVTRSVSQPSAAALRSQTAVPSSLSRTTAAGDPPPAPSVDVVAEPAAEARPVVAASQAAVPATVRLELSFTEECWVEISDASRRLLYGLEKEGSVRSFEARLPLRFYLGKTDGVDISLAGVTYNVPPEVRTGRNTARFVVGVDDLQALRQ